MNIDAFRHIADLIRTERVRQDAKWGVVDHHDVPPSLTYRESGCVVGEMAYALEIPTEARARDNCKAAGEAGEDTWAHIAVEEMAEVVHAATLAQQGLGPEEDVDRELVQLAAVIVAWIEARQRRTV